MREWTDQKGRERAWDVTRLELATRLAELLTEVLFAEGLLPSDEAMNEEDRGREGVGL